MTNWFNILASVHCGNGKPVRRLRAIEDLNFRVHNSKILLLRTFIKYGKLKYLQCLFIFI